MHHLDCPEATLPPAWGALGTGCAHGRGLRSARERLWTGDTLEIDLVNADSVGEQLASACASGGAIVIADMTATTFCDSTGLRMLVLAWEWAKDHGIELRLVVTRPGVWRMLEMQGADLVLPVYPSLAKALAREPIPGDGDSHG